MKSLIRYIVPATVFLVDLTYIILWTNHLPEWALHFIVYSENSRPYVYRLLAPALDHFLIDLFSIRIDVSIWIVQMCFAMGFYFATRALVYTFTHDLDKSSIMAAIPSLLIYGIMIPWGKVYDVPTAFFFTLCLALLARRKWFYYCIAFFIACFNRETMFLMILFFGIYFLFSGMTPRLYSLLLGFQIIAYVMIKNLIASAFTQNPGQSFYIQLFYNIHYFWTHPAMTIFVLMIISILFILISRDWKYKPDFLRQYLLIIFPVQVLLHLILGNQFEFRVYIETFPILIMMSMPLIVQYPADNPNENIGALFDTKTA